MRARDFLISVGSASEDRPLRAWHEHLGGRPEVWSSPLLDCRLYGSVPATTVTARAGQATFRAACVLTGAPIAFRSIDVDTVQQRLLDAYLVDGIGALRQVNGSFCGVLIDELRRELIVFTDRFGFRKAFVARMRGAVYASSRAVVLGRGLALPPDPAGVVCSTLVGHTIGRRTLFSGCDALLPATVVDLPDGRERQYWDVGSYAAERRRSHRDTADLCERFNAACRSIVVAQDVPALNLTGGFDTRAVLSGALTAQRPLVAVTAGSVEQAAIHPIVVTTGIDHHVLEFDPRSAAVGDERFALLTDGEWDSTGGGALLTHWQRLERIVPSGCLHGGVGEVWRAYYYQLLWPLLGHVRHDPVGFLAERITCERRHLIAALAAPLQRSALDVVRADVEALWQPVRRTAPAGDILASVDAFYLLERQRGLTRIASAADLWNPVYSPFAYSTFIEKGLGFLGAQNRGDRLHRDLITRNARSLAALPRYSGGDCLSRSVGVSTAGGMAATARHLVGRAVGGRLRRRIQGSDDTQYPYRLPRETDGGSALYDLGQLRRIAAHTKSGLGSIAAVTAALGDTTSAVARAS